MTRQEHHVVHNSNGGWDIRRNNSQRSSGHFDTKKETINRARQISKNQKTEMIIHNMNGKISNSDSHGNDPCPPKDKN
ncbi:DUF2188 domain-containing protein [Clostridium autoethanogenum]|uniref:DUF2188 domain-containing protein n=1 Tax=Clostridium autoethanogenum TaxID=84023 RepID=A0A3M0SHU2_9CLOT|nr:DUF2188 domain-containing protein [Clostridium autoethanogenum]RMC97795.1 DUF2188 domain-containing protein [Clostridium autoethanogenum]